MKKPSPDSPIPFKRRSRTADEGMDPSYFGENTVDLETRRRIVEECYRRHGHKVLVWLSQRAVPVKTERLRKDAVVGEKVWAAAVMELNAYQKERPSLKTGS